MKTRGRSFHKSIFIVWIGWIGLECLCSLAELISNSCFSWWLPRDEL